MELNMDFESARLEAVELIGLFSTRVKWSVFQASIRTNAVPKARNYDSLIIKLTQLQNDLVGIAAVDAVLGLKGRYITQAISGDKAVKITKVSDEDLGDLITAMSAVQNTFESSDSFFSNETHLGVQDTPELMHWVQIGNDLILTFNASREVSKKETLPREALTEYFFDKLPSGGQIYYVKKIVKRCYDIVSLHRDTGFVEFRIDNSENFSVDERLVANHMLEVAFNSFCETYIGRLIKLSTLNLFPAVRAMHDLPAGDGRVVELHFVTDEGGVKANKKRHRKTGCILNENFHIGGCDRIQNQLNPYRIARSWSYSGSSFQSEPELMLPGNLRMVSEINSNSYLNEAIISKCVGHQDYSMLINKLLNLVQTEQTEQTEQTDV